MTGFLRPDAAPRPSTEILDSLVASPRETVDRLRAGDGEPAPIIAALVLAPDPRTRQLLCDVLGFRKELAALEPLLACLADAAPEVRSAAADALAKLADRRAGPALLARATLPETDPGTLQMLVAALGAVGHAPAVPLLITHLRSDDASLRGCAAWALGALRAHAAVPELRLALRSECSPYPAGCMRAALAALGW